MADGGDGGDGGDEVDDRRTEVDGRDGGVGEAALRRGTVAALTLALAVPVVVALVALREPRWYPLVDMAQIELRVRDVPTTHPPLLGLGGRITGFGTNGSHPGPLAFYFLWPVYRLLGGSAWALQVSSAALSLLAAGIAVWLGHRRGGTPLAVGVAVGLALLLRGYGAVMVTEPWNPRLPVVWWVAFLLAVWSVLDGDERVLPLAVLAGSYCMQTHVPYVPIVVGTGVLAVGAVALRARRHPGDRADLRRWVAISAGLLVLLWLPPLYEQLTRDPGNMAVIYDNFRHPYDDRVSRDLAVDVWLRHLDVTSLLRGEVIFHGVPVRGMLFLAAWAGAAALAWRRGNATLLRLHLVAAVATVVGLVAVTRVFGPLWPYLAYWMWGTTTLALVAAVWSLLPGGDGARRRTVAGGAVALVLAVAAFTADAPDTEMEGAELSADLAPLARDTVERLAADPLGCGDDCTYLVTWSDPVTIGAAGYGLLLELERQGFDVRAEGWEATAVRAHRTAGRDEVDAEIHLSAGDPDVAEWEARDDAELVAVVDPHSPDERAEYLRIRRDLVEQIEADGDPALAEEVARSMDVRTDPRMSADARALAYFAGDYERRTAVFLADPEADPR